MKRLVGRFSLLVLPVAMLLPACAGSAKPAPASAGAAAEPPASGTAEPAASAAPASTSAASAVEQLLSEQEWLTDAEGREYMVLRYPKTSAYRKLEGGRVRIGGGAEFELLGEDEEALDLKILRPVKSTEERVPVKPKPSAEQLAAAEAAYRAVLPASDRLRLEPFDRGLPNRGLWRNGFDLADLNADGKLDLVHGPPRKGGDQLRVFLGDGSGGWSPWATRVPAGLLDYGDVRVADFNRDGHPDVAAAVHLRGIVVLLGDGQGGFTPSSTGLDFKVPVIGQPVPLFSSRRVETLDWNQDGLPDLLALSEGPTPNLVAPGVSPARSSEVKSGEAYSRLGPRLYVSRGDGSWRPLQPPAAAKDLFGDDIAIADFDGDGASDFIISSNLMGRPDLLFRHGATPGEIVPSEIPVRPRGYVNAVSQGDFDGDGRPDIALSYTNFELGVARTGIDLLRAGAGGSWDRRPLLSRAGRVGFRALGAGDVDGDRALDLVAVERDGDVYLFLGDGRGGFASESSPEAQKPRGRCRGYKVQVEDLDGDGAGEILASFADEPVAIHDPERCTGHGGVMAWKARSGKSLP